MSLSPQSQKLITNWADEVNDLQGNPEENDDEEILRAASGDIDLFKDYTNVKELAETIRTKIKAVDDSQNSDQFSHDRKDSSDTANIEEELKRKSMTSDPKSLLPPLAETSRAESPELEYVNSEEVKKRVKQVDVLSPDDKMSYASHRETADLRERLEHLEEILHQLQEGRERDITHRKNTQIQINQILREMKTFDSNLNKVNSTLNASLTKFLSQVQTSLEAVSSGSHARRMHDQIDASYVDLNNHLDKAIFPPSFPKSSPKSDLREKLNKIRLSNK